GAPDDPAPSCQNRDQVLQWYRRGRADGVRAQVTEMVVRADKILVGLKVVGNQAAAEAGDEADRWQVLAVRHGRIVDIRGFEDRATAASRVGLPMGAIFHVNEGALAWSDYRSDSGPAAIRYKALTAGASDVPPVQYIEYGPGETDAVHQHEIGEFFILTSGEMWLDNTKAGP